MSGCTARWAIEKILPRADDPFGAAEFGTAGHRVFEQVFSLPSEQRTTQVAMEFVSNLQNDTAATSQSRAILSTSTDGTAASRGSSPGSG